MKLSILICTVDTRNATELIKQLSRHDIELLWLGDNRQMSIGEKRNWLLSMAKGEYVVFIDDDDEVSDMYVDELLKGCESGADVVCFNVMYCPVVGEPMPVIYSKDYEDTTEKDHYRRVPNHLMCFNRELALSVMFKEVNFGEDYDFAQRMKPLIKTEHRIKKVLYNYRYSFENSESEKRQHNG